jgi:hypothetical protein
MVASFGRREAIKQKTYAKIPYITAKPMFFV